MAKNSVAEWDTTAANNTDIAGLSILGTAPVSNFDDGLRNMMAQLASERDRVNAAFKRPFIRTWNVTGTVGHTGSSPYGIADGFDNDEISGSFAISGTTDGNRGLLNKRIGLHRFTIKLAVVNGGAGRISLRAQNTEVLDFIQVPANFQGTLSHTFFARLTTVDTLLSYLITADTGTPLNLYHAKDGTTFRAEWVQA